MKTINYITYDSWWDTDKTILPIVSLEYRLNIVVVSPNSNKKYTTKEKFGGGHFVEVEQKYRDRDIRSVFTAIRVLYTLNKISTRSKDYYWFIPAQNPILQLLMYLFLPKERTIITFHNYIPHYIKKRYNFANCIGWIYAKNKIAICKKFIKFLFYSENQCRIFEADFKQKKVAVCNMPLKDFGNFHAKHHEGRVFLFFGFIQEYKRLDLFVNAGVKCNSQQAKFIIAGRPTFDSSDVIEKAKAADNFQCDIRFIKDEEVLGYFEKADFLVLPYTDTTQSGPLLIALNYGIPVIASDISVFKSFIDDGVNGYLFHTGDVNSLYKCYEKAVNISNEELCNMRAAQKRKGQDYRKTTNPLNALTKII